MAFDRKLLYAALVAVVSIALIAAFYKPAFADADYGALLGSSIPMETMGTINLLLLALLPLAIYLICVYALKDEEFHSMLAALLFAFSGASTSALFSISPVAGILLDQSTDLGAAIKLGGALLPIGLVALLGYKKEPIPALLAALGVLLIPFAPGFSAVLLALAAASGMRILEHEPYGDKALVLAVLIFSFQGFYSKDALAAVVSALFVAALFYVAISLHNVKPRDVYALVLLFLAFEALTSVYLLNQARAQSLSQDEIALFSSLRGAQGSYGVLDYPKAFQYFSGKQSVLLNSSQLLKKNASLPGYVVYTKRAFTKAYSSQPILFSFYAVGTDNSGGQVALFANSRYALYMRLSQSEIAPEDAQLLNLQTGEGSIIPFTKIKQLSRLPYNDSSNLMVDVQDIGDTTLYGLLFNSGASFEKNATVIRVQ
ncbi:MAG: hypothetical protein PHS02_00960 [Candidatus ainarchaeum sp.]|nr:hypothetical protein [Candidatus ainarchaeum sp.]